MIKGVLFRRGVILVSRRALFHVLSSPDRLVERRFFFRFFFFSLLYDISSKKSLFVNRHTLLASTAQPLMLRVSTLTANPTI